MISPHDTTLQHHLLNHSRITTTSGVGVNLTENAHLSWNGKAAGMEILCAFCRSHVVRERAATVRPRTQSLTRDQQTPPTFTPQDGTPFGAGLLVPCDDATPEDDPFRPKRRNSRSPSVSGRRASASVSRRPSVSTRRASAIDSRRPSAAGIVDQHPPSRRGSRRLSTSSLDGCAITQRTQIFAEQAGEHDELFVELPVPYKLKAGVVMNGKDKVATIQPIHADNGEHGLRITLGKNNKSSSAALKPLLNGIWYRGARDASDAPRTIGVALKVTVCLESEGKTAAVTMEGHYTVEVLPEETANGEEEEGGGEGIGEGGTPECQVEMDQQNSVQA